MRPKVPASVLLLLLLSVSLSAQTQDDLKSEWLSQDIAAIQHFLPPLAQNDLTLESLEKLLGKESDERMELGFGARTFTFSKGGGYTNFSVIGLAFDGRIGYYRITVGGSSTWPKIRRDIIQAWQMNAQLPFNEGQYGIEYSKENPTVVAEYKGVVGSQIGELKTVVVPADLQDAYEYLISLKNNSVVGSGGCGFAPVVPQGKTSIDKIVSSGREDLIENVLRGYNPGGRIYAVLALLEQERNGRKLSTETQNAIRVVLDLPIKIYTCSGCLLYHRTAREIVLQRD